MDVFEAVRDRREELGVPGVAVGLLDGGAERHEAFGVTSVEQPLAVTPDTRFQIGSISLWSYNNAGFAVAGRVVEVVTGERFEDVVRTAAGRSASSRCSYSGRRRASRSPFSRTTRRTGCSWSTPPSPLRA